MSPSENMVHVRLDPANMKTAKRFAKRYFRDNMTAYFNFLVAQDSNLEASHATRVFFTTLEGLDKKIKVTLPKRVSGLKHPTKAAKKR